MSGTLIGIFLETVQKYDKPAQFIRKTARGWEPISAKLSLEDVENLALGLESLGIARGDRVAILSENRYEWPVADLATLEAAAPDYPESKTLKERALYKKAVRAAKKGDEFLQRKELELALVAYVQSEQCLPGFKPAVEGIQEVRSALERLSKRAQDQFLEAVRKLPEYRFIEVHLHTSSALSNDR